MKGKNGLIHLYMGTGKGKTTAALGLGLRAAGSGLQVDIIQFMKGSASNEAKAINHIPHFSIKNFGRNVFLTENVYEPIDEKLALKGLNYAKKIIKKQTCDMLILDEITIAVAFNLLKKEEVITVLNNKPTELTIVLTGRIADNEFISLADLVTNMNEVKHPYQQGGKPKPGFDY